MELAELTSFKKTIIAIRNEEGLDPTTIPEKFSIQEVHGVGKFRCSCYTKGNRRQRRSSTSVKNWSNKFTWIRLDLTSIEKPIIYRYHQKCRHCFEPRKPWWDEEEFERMVRYAVQRCKGLMDGTWAPQQIQRSEDFSPHRNDLCEKCEYGDRKCWQMRRPSSYALWEGYTRQPPQMNLPMASNYTFGNY